MSESRKWGVYCIANLQFKTYFKVGLPGPSGLYRLLTRMRAVESHQSVEERRTIDRSTIRPASVP